MVSAISNLLPFKAECEKILFASSGSQKRLLDLFLLTLYAGNIIRAVAIYVDWTSNGHYGLIDFDFAYRIVAETKLVSANFLLFLIFFIVYGIYLHYFLYYFFGTGPETLLQCYRQVNLVNPRMLIQDNRKLLKNFRKVSKKNALELCRFTWKLFRKDENVLDKICFRRHLPRFPMLTKKDRVNEFLLYLGSELIILFFMFIYPFLFVFAIYLFWPIMSSFTGSWLDWAVVMGSGGAIYYGGNKILRASTTIMGIILVATSAINFSFGRLNRMLRGLAGKTSRRGTTIISPAIIINYRLFGFYREHHRMSNFINTARDHWQVMFFVAILTNIPLNVNCFKVIVLSRHKIDAAHVAFTSILIFQFVLSFLAIYPAACNATAAHRAGKYMVPLQPKISNLRLKLKWAQYHEVVHNSRFTIAYQASLLGRLTVFSVVKFVFFYVETLIFAYSKR